MVGAMLCYLFNAQGKIKFKIAFGRISHRFIRLARRGAKMVSYYRTGGHGI